MDIITDVIINLLAHRIGVRVLRFLSGGRFDGQSGFAWGWAVVVGGFILLAPFAAGVGWLIYSRIA